MFTNILDRDMALCEVASHDGPEAAIALLDNIVSQCDEHTDPLDAGVAATILFMTANYELARHMAEVAVPSEEGFMDEYGQRSGLARLILRALDQEAPFTIMLKSLRDTKEKVMALAEERYGKGE